MTRTFKRGISDRAIKHAKAFFENTHAGQVVCKGVADGNLIVCIRDGYFNVYRNGNALLKFKPLATKHKFLISRRLYQKYCPNSTRTDDSTPGDETHLSLNLDDGSESEREYVEEILQGQGEKPDSGDEKVLIQEYLRSKRPCLIDLEVAFATDGEARPVAKRIDLALLEPCGASVTLRFIEAKKALDPRLKSEEEEPEIEKQMRAYENFLREEANEILSSYKRIARNYTTHFPDLLPEFCDKTLMERFSEENEGKLDPKPGMLLMGEDIAGQLRGKHPRRDHLKVLEDLFRKNGWEIRKYDKQTRSG